MPQIKAAYSKLYGKDMVKDIKSDISGDYQWKVQEQMKIP
jgi:hypothetical protein